MTEIQRQITEQIESGKLLIKQTENGWLLTASIEEGDTPPVAATYKDRIFRMIFKEKKELLMLYNAMNSTHYDDPEALSVTTLDNAIYLGMKNDISFVLYDKLMLYEHQSTKKPNMPLRNLFYVSDVYSGLTKDKNLYSSARFSIPEPRFTVFYNGLDKMPEKSVLKLSDMYTHRAHPNTCPCGTGGLRPIKYKNVSGQVSLELITQVFNINLGYNKELLDNCRTLHGYAAFVDLVRKYQKTENSLKTAISKAIDECIANNILADFLRTNKAEVLKMSIYEYDEARQRQFDREEGRQAGLTEGRQAGLAEGRQAGLAEERQTSIRNLIETSQELGSSREDTVKRVAQKYSVSEDDVREYVTKCWKQ